MNIIYVALGVLLLVGIISVILIITKKETLCNKNYQYGCAPSADVSANINPEKWDRYYNEHYGDGFDKFVHKYADPTCEQMIKDCYNTKCNFV